MNWRRWVWDTVVFVFWFWILTVTIGMLTPPRESAWRIFEWCVFVVWIPPTYDYWKRRLTKIK